MRSSYPEPTIGGMRVVENEAMSTMVEDWSKVRSPGRARRRRHKHRQNIGVIYVPHKHFFVDTERDIIYCHPETAKVLYAEIDKRNAGPEVREYE